jgi:hypothetical protein
MREMRQQGIGDIDIKLAEVALSDPEVWPEQFPQISKVNGFAVKANIQGVAVAGQNQIGSQ